MKAKLDKMKKEANNHQTKLEQIIQKLSESQVLNSGNIQSTASETEQKASQMMNTYLGDEPDSSEALEFLCLVEGGEVTHYEVLSTMTTKKVKDRQVSTAINSILREERRHLQACTRLAKRVPAS